MKDALVVKAVVKAEFKEIEAVAEETQGKTGIEIAIADADNIHDGLFAEQDWEIDSIMREIGAR